jgi:RNA polymerase sigma-70 factor (ECF subfamily)
VKAQKQSEEVFNQKYKDYSQLIFNIAFSYTHNVQEAEDIMSEDFLRYLVKYRDYSNLVHEKNWLIRTAINIANDKWRKNQKSQAFAEQNANSQEAGAEDLSEKDMEIFEIVASLPPIYKETIVLYFYADMSIKEIASALKISESNVMKRLERGRDMIKLQVKN